MEENPDIEVEVWHMGGGGTTGAGGMKDVVVAQMITRTAADVIYGWGGIIHSHKQYLAELTDAAASAGIDVERDFVFNYDQQFDREGKLWTWPMNQAVSGWLYNIDMFDEAGLDYPTEDWTWLDMKEAATALTKPEEKQYGAYIIHSLWFGMGELLYANGGRMLSDDRTETALCSPESLEAFEFVVDLMFKDKVAMVPGEVAGLLGPQIRDPFVTGNVAMRTTGLHGVGGTIRTIGDRFRWAAMPTPKSPTTDAKAFQENMECWSIFRETINRGTFEAAFEYLLFFGSDFVQRMYAMLKPTIPYTWKWLESKEFLEAPENAEQIITNLQMKGKPGWEHVSMMFCPPWGEWWRATLRETEKAYTGEVPPREALTTACEAGDRVLDEFWKTNPNPYLTSPLAP
jgi:multiple sugar transport system substrate-binding protein